MHKKQPKRDRLETLRRGREFETPLDQVLRILAFGPRETVAIEKTMGKKAATSALKILQLTKKITITNGTAIFAF